MKLDERRKGSFQSWEDAVRWDANAVEEWRELFRCWYWLDGPGSTERVMGDGYDNAERETCKRILRARGWSIETVVEAHDWARDTNFRLRRLPLPKRNRSSTRADSFDDDGGGDSGHAQILAEWTPQPRVCRDKPAEFRLTDGERQAMLNKAIGGLARMANPSRPARVAKVEVLDTTGDSDDSSPF